MRFKTEEIIEGDISDVFSEVLNIYEWPKIMPHVFSVEDINSCNGIQHVAMGLRSKNNSISIETIRKYKINKWISFNQLSLHKIIKRHVGTWKFIQEGNKTRIKCYHEIICNSVFNLLISLVVWYLYIKPNSKLALLSLKLKFECQSINRLVSDSCFMKHEIVVGLPLQAAFDEISCPNDWPRLYPTALNTVMLLENDDLYEFEIVERVGFIKFKSHCIMHKDCKNKIIYYQHYPPTYPFKYMVIRWFFIELNPKATKFVILREFGITVPIIGRFLGNTCFKMIINKHVSDYHNDLKNHIEGLGSISDVK